jgi:hypothetical protein
MRMGLHIYKGKKRDTIQCGEMKFLWLYIANISSTNAELSPTPWASITDVNVHDSRIQWYRKDESRIRITVHIDKLWDKPRAIEGKP